MCINKVISLSLMIIYFLFANRAIYNYPFTLQLFALHNYSIFMRYFNIFWVLLKFPYFIIVCMQHSAIMSILKDGSVTSV